MTATPDPTCRCPNGNATPIYAGEQTCQLVRIFHKLYGFFVIPQAYGHLRGISLRIYLFTKSFIFLRFIYADFVRYCQTTTLNKCPTPYNYAHCRRCKCRNTGGGGVRRTRIRRRRSCSESLPTAEVQVIQTSSKF